MLIRRHAALLAAGIGMVSAASGTGAQAAGAGQETGGLPLATTNLDERVQTVTFSGQVLLRIRTGAGGYTAEQRADAVRERLPLILGLINLRPSEITVQQPHRYMDANIYVRDRLLITVDKTLAQANGNNDPGDLARQWADRMRHILPTVSIKQSKDIPESKGQ